MNQVPGSRAGQKSPVVGAKGRNPAQRSTPSIESTTEPEDLKHHQQSMVNHSRESMMQQQCHSRSRVQPQQRRAGHRAQPPKQSGQQTKSQGHEDLTKRTVPYQRPGRQPRKRETSVWNHQRSKKNFVRQGSQTTWEARHNPAAANMQQNTYNANT